MSLNGRHRDREGVFSGEKAERAIIDIGSNTVRLVIYGGSPRAPLTLFNEKVAARLGRDIAKTGRLAEEGIELALRGLARYALLLDDLDIEDVETVATAAVREAENGPKFLERVAALGIRPRLLSGEEEARISAMGALGAFPGARGTVADLGGGSLELTPIGDGAAQPGVSLPLGTLRLPELRERHGEELSRAIARILKKQGPAATTAGPLYLVGGTWRAMAVYAMAMSESPLSDPHGCTLDAGAARKLARTIAGQSPARLKQSPRISSMRAAYLPDAAALLEVLLDHVAPDRIVFSSWGLREGLLFERLASYAREQDPLLAGVAWFAAQRGTPATMAARVAAWTVDAVPTVRGGSERLRLAATMLALSSMQTEPNLRISQAVDWALHKRWLAIAPEGRGMLAAAACGNGNACDLPDEVKALASPDCLEEAICWGLAVRLCRRLGARSRRSLAASRLGIEGDRLVLRLAESHAALFGAPNEKDLRIFAQRLGLKSEMRVVPEEALVRFTQTPIELVPPAG